MPPGELGLVTPDSPGSRRRWRQPERPGAGIRIVRLSTLERLVDLSLLDLSRSGQNSARRDFRSFVGSRATPRGRGRSLAACPRRRRLCPILSARWFYAAAVILLVRGCRAARRHPDAGRAGLAATPRPQYPADPRHLIRRPHAGEPRRGRVRAGGRCNQGVGLMASIGCAAASCTLTSRGRGRHDKHSNARWVVAMNALLPIRSGHTAKSGGHDLRCRSKQCRSHHAPTLA